MTDPADLEQLVDLLGRERTLLDVLIFRLVELRSLLVCGADRHLDWAAEEVEDATGSVRAVELHRALLVSRIAEGHGVLGGELTLGMLVAMVDPPWRALLADHQTGLRALAAEVEEHTSAIRRLSRTTATSLASVIDRLETREPAWM